MTSVQETPQVFTLALLLCILVSFVVFLIVVYRAIRGHRARALTLLSRWVLAALVYLTISVTVATVKPPRIVEQGQNWCFDDWCIAVEAVRHVPSPDGANALYTTDVRIYNDARRPQSVQGFWVYLRDQDDHRYEPRPGGWSQVVATRVPPHGIARTSIDFVVPANARQLGLVSGHGTGAPCGVLPSLLEIGQGGCLFHRPNMIRVE